MLRCLSLLLLLLLFALSLHGHFYVTRLANEELRSSLAEAALQIERATGERVLLQRLPLTGHIPSDALLVVDASLLRYDSTEAEIQRWLHDEWGLRHYIPGEYEVLGDPESVRPFHVWRNEDTESSRYLSRNLHDIGRERYGEAETHWARSNRLHEQFSFNHALYRIIRPEHFESHPEWFAKDESGEPMRPPHRDPSGFNDQPNLSQDGVVEHVAEAAIEHFSGHPESLSFSISANDSFEFGHFPDDYRWFDDDRYFRRYPDYSNHVFRFSNRVAEKVSDAFPQRYLGALAYLSWENIPDFPVHPRIIPYLTADRSQWYDVEFREQDLELVQAWSEAGPEIVGTWDYIFGYGFLIPRSLRSVVSESIPELYENGVRAYFSQVSPLWAFDGHTTWLTAQLLDDATADPIALINEYFEHFYGPASDTMWHFFSVPDFIWMYQPGEAVWLRYYLDAHQAWLYTEGHLTLLRELLDRAEEEADEGHSGNGENRYLRRVGYTSQAFELTETFVRYVHLKWAFSRGQRGPVSAPRSEDPAFELDPESWQDLEGVLATERDLREMEERFRRQLADLLDSSPVHQRFADSDWALYGDPGPRRLWQIQRDQIPARSMQVAELDVDEDRWRIALLDTEDASLELNAGSARAEDVRRGQLFTVVPVEAGELYAAEVLLRGECGPSANIFVRLDWYDAAGNRLQESSWDRLPPGTYEESFRLGPVERAPESASFVRLFIRFYEQEPGDWIEIDSAAMYHLDAAEAEGFEASRSR